MAGTRRKAEAEPEAEEETTEPEAEESAEESATEEAAAPAGGTYHRDRLIAESNAFFGVDGWVVVGALAFTDAGDREEFSTDEISAAIQAFMDHEVEMVHGEGA